MKTRSGAAGTDVPGRYGLEQPDFGRIGLPSELGGELGWRVARLLARLGQDDV